ncbi:hypothetical protein [Fusobacterium necrophorum]|jgi:hypothetical protein|uniref:Uncharacterized protein n=1 Tax=Fusobacterium necrophorum subsp. funduliforme TaxID=143387 RepID=A0A162J7D3_9FUSO|nr:hypothetical protein [Fusobacterium necrophorum]KYL05270.1 hypothetical protein A2J07_00615 [Fusobacterium necrophorum subsp. funduliforme]
MNIKIFKSNDTEFEERYCIIDTDNEEYMIAFNKSTNEIYVSPNYLYICEPFFKQISIFEFFANNDAQEFINNIKIPHGDFREKEMKQFKDKFIKFIQKNLYD